MGIQTPHQTTNTAIKDACHFSHIAFSSVRFTVIEVEILRAVVSITLEFQRTIYCENFWQRWSGLQFKAAVFCWTNFDFVFLASDDANITEVVIAVFASDWIVGDILTYDAVELETLVVDFFLVMTLVGVDALHGGFVFGVYVESLDLVFHVLNIRVVHVKLGVFEALYHLLFNNNFNY